MNDRRFSISIHILLLLANRQDQWLSSDSMASSMNINPVIVRKELMNLRRYGLVVSKEGKNGGSKIAQRPEQIYLSDLYMMVSTQSILGNNLPSPDKECFVGKQINQHLAKLNTEMEDVVVSQLFNQTLADFMSKFQ